MQRIRTASHAGRLLGICLSLACAASVAQAQSTQALAEVWRTIDSSFTGVSMDLTPSDDLVEVGYSILGDVLVTKKIDRNGTLLWSRVFDPAERVRASWIASDRAGNVFVAGYSICCSNWDPTGLLTLKYDAQGTLLWSDFIPGSWAQTVRVKTDAAGNAYVAGRVWQTSPSSSFITFDFALIKYAPDGRRLWVRVFDSGGGAMDEPSSMAISPDGSRIVLAGKAGQSFLAVAYTSDGALAWSHMRPGVGPANDVAFGAGGDVVAGASTWTYATSNMMTILKFDASGAPVWTRSYTVGDFVWRIAVDSAGNIAAAGVDQVWYSNWVTIKTDAAGNLLWSRTYDGHSSNNENPYGIAIDPFDAVYVIGQGGPGPSGGMLSTLRIVIAKYAADGAQQWVTFGESGQGLAVRVGSDGSIFALGAAQMFTVRYQETGLPDLPPAAPDALAAAGGFTGAAYVVNLSWRDNSTNELFVEVERCTGASCTNFTAVGRTRGENGTGFQDRAVAGGTTYSYRVRAIGAAGPSPYSDIARATTPLIVPPAAPTALTATATDTSVTLAWTDNATDEGQFVIEKCTGSSCTAFSQIDATYANVTTYTDWWVQPGETYSYRVRAWNSGGYSAYSNVATATVGGAIAGPSAPSALTATALSVRGRIELRWINTSVSQETVFIERCDGTTCSAFVQIASVAGTAAQFVDRGLQSRRAYTYRIRAYGAGRYSPYSNTAMAMAR